MMIKDWMSDFKKTFIKMAIHWNLCHLQHATIISAVYNFSELDNILLEN